MENQTEKPKIKRKKGNKPIYELKTPGGYSLDEVVSSLQKTIRRGEEEKALYWMMELVRGRFIAYLWRRLSVITIEDIGLADINAPLLINSLAQMNERVNKNGFIEIFHPTMAVIYLCRAPKSREIDYAYDYIDLKRKSGWKLQVSTESLDQHTEKGRELIRKLRGNYQKNADDKFYYEGALLNKPISIEKDKYKKRVWKLRNLDKNKFNLRFKGDGVVMINNGH
jgi:replication-associated recombination protein RarA